MVYPDELKESLLAEDFQCLIDSLYTEDKPELIFENQGIDVGNITKTWIKFSVNISYRNPVSLGLRRRYIRKGVITILIGVPSGTLTNEIQVITQNIINHYEGVKIKDVYIRDIKEGSITQTDNAWFTRSLIISFDYYIIK